MRHQATVKNHTRHSLPAKAREVNAHHEKSRRTRVIRKRSMTNTAQQLFCYDPDPSFHPDSRTASRLKRLFTVDFLRRAMYELRETGQSMKSSEKVSSRRSAWVYSLLDLRMEHCSNALVCRHERRSVQSP